MPQNYITIRSGRLFQWHIMFVAVLLIIASFVIIGEHPAIAALLSFISLIIFTGRSGMEIDINNKTYREYSTFFHFIRLGKTEPYGEIEYLFINSDKVKQRMETHSTANSYTLSDTVYNAFIKFDDGEKIKLWSEKNKQIMDSKLKALSERLNTSVIDYTEIKEQL